MSVPKPERSEAAGPLTFDEVYFTRLINEQGPFLQRFFLSRGASVSDVQDLAQESFRVFWEKRQIAEPGKEGAFMNSIARHVLLNHRRKLRSRQILSNKHQTVISDALHTEPAAAWAGLAEDEQTQQVTLLFDMLPERMAQVMGALYLDGKTRKETAALLGVTSRAVLKAEAEALKKLRTLLRIQQSGDN